jgi:hypothetical protein
VIRLLILPITPGAGRPGPLTDTLPDTVSFRPNVQVTGDRRELNKFDLGDSDIAILGLKMSKNAKKN